MRPSDQVDQVASTGVGRAQEHLDGLLLGLRVLENTGSIYARQDRVQLPPSHGTMLI